MRLQCLICYALPLEVVLVVPCNDDIVYFQHHSTQLRGQQQLLAFTDQRVNDKMFSHICLELAIATALESRRDGKRLTITARLHAVHA
jgi:hypothetical protein